MKQKKIGRWMITGLSAAVLAACGGNQDAGNARMLATSTACFAAWNSTVAYNGGAQVSYNGVNYTAAYWTQGQNPSTNNGPSGSGQPWVSNGACGATPTPTPTPAPTPTPTPAPTPTPTPTPTGSCPQYVSGYAYATGDKVTNVGNYYQCTVGGWCSQGGAYDPGTGWAWQNAWTQIAASQCGGTPTPTPTPAPTPSPTPTPTPAPTPAPTPTPSGGSPYGGTPWTLPGTVQAENFNTGGNLVAYWDATSTNDGGQYRTNEGVDIEASTDTGGGYDLGWVVANEYLNYTVNITAAGTYTIQTRVSSSGQGGTFHYMVDGANATAALTIPDTGGWQNWQTLSSSITLPAGNHLVQLHMDSVGPGGNVGNFNWFSVSTATTTAARRQQILNYLGSISGSKTLVGIENKDAANPHSDSDRITAITGRQSSFWGGDFGFGSGAVNNRQTLINEARRQFGLGTLVGLMYHACAPTQNELCSWDDIGGAHPVHLTDAQWNQLVTPGTSLYNTWIGRLDTLAGYFQQLKDAGVVTLFRPLHEMNQCVFWWSCHTGANGSARLYQITHDYLTNTKHLDNIIWVWNVQDFTSLASDVNTYNPGTAYFDIAALDVYNTGYTTGNYNAMLGVSAGKPIAIAECQFMPTSSLLAQQNKWIFAMLWPDFVSDNQNTIGSLYAAGNVLTLDEMPGWH